MNKIMILILMLIIGSLLFNSCSGFFTESHLKLAKGTTLEDFKSFDINYKKSFLLEKMNQKNKGKFEVYMTKIKGPYYYEVYYYAFRNDSLLFWGHPYKFNRHENPIIKEIGETSMEYARQLYGLNADEVK